MALRRIGRWSDCLLVVSRESDFADVWGAKTAVRVPAPDPARERGPAPACDPPLDLQIGRSNAGQRFEAGDATPPDTKAVE